MTAFWRRLALAAAAGVGTLATLTAGFAAGGVLLPPGSRGSAVRILQAELNVLGAGPVPETGIYGRATTAAVRRFQQGHHLLADGVAGPLTRSALTRAVQGRLHLGAVTVRMSDGVRLEEALHLAGLKSAERALAFLDQRMQIAATDVGSSRTVRSLRSTLSTPVAEAAAAPAPLSSPPTHPSPPPVSPPPRLATAPVPAPSVPVPAPPAPQPVPPPSSGTFQVLGFMTAYGSGASAQDALAHLGMLDALSPLWYAMSGDGLIHGGASGTVASVAKAQGKEVLPMVTNRGDGMLQGAAVRAAAAQNLLGLAEQGGYAGVNIDFEGLPAADRAAFTAFVQEVAALFHARGLLVSVDVGPKFTSDPAANPAAAVYDYAALGAAADRIIVMTYDLHGPGTSPGPVSAPSWDQEVLRYTLTRIPAAKILLGIAAYGYDWSVNGVNPVSDAQAHALASGAGAAIQWSSSDQEPYFTYVQNGVSHQVWWDNSQAFSARLQVARQDGIGGVAIWRLGDEGSRFWQVLAQP